MHKGYKPQFLGFKLETKDDEAVLNIFDEIGEWEDLDGTVCGYGPKKLTSELAECKAQKLNVHINSLGGDVFEGIAIHNILKDCGKDVTVTIDGIAASAASIIAMAGKVKMHPTSQMMIHNCWTYTCGNAKELRKTADQMDKVMESAKQAYLSHAGSDLDPQYLDTLLDEETYLSAADAFAFGLCDEIIGVPATKATKETLATMQEKAEDIIRDCEQNLCESKEEIQKEPEPDADIEHPIADQFWFF